MAKRKQRPRILNGRTVGELIASEGIPVERYWVNKDGLFGHYKDGDTIVWLVENGRLARAIAKYLRENGARPNE